MPGGGNRTGAAGTAPIRTARTYDIALLRVSLINTTYSLIAECGFESLRTFQMIHKGIEFSLTQVMAGVWKWRFQIGNRVFTGKTEAKLDLLAIRRVQLRIDRELKQLGREQARGNGDTD
jgi:hypothetical protein